MWSLVRGLWAVSCDSPSYLSNAPIAPPHPSVLLLSCPPILFHLTPFIPNPIPCPPPQAPYGYDQRAEVLGLKGMIATDNMYPNTARIFTKDSTRNADLPYDFFMSRYKEAYLQVRLLGGCRGWWGRECGGRTDGRVIGMGQLD